MIYLRYLKSLCAHKWFVFLAGRKTGVSLWRLIIHDWSKFTRAEFGPYARHFFGNYPSSEESIALAIDYAWLNHQKKNQHHWQYWSLVFDDDPRKQNALPMPEHFVREMVADWMGASRVYTNSWDMTQWLEKNLPNVAKNLHPTTMTRLQTVLAKQGYSNA